MAVLTRVPKFEKCQIWTPLEGRQHHSEGLTQGPRPLHERHQNKLVRCIHGMLEQALAHLAICRPFGRKCCVKSTQGLVWQCYSPSKAKFDQFKLVNIEKNSNCKANALAQPHRQTIKLPNQPHPKNRSDLNLMTKQIPLSR